MKIKNCVDHFASIGYKIYLLDHLNAIFNGLTEEYNMFIVSMNHVIPNVKNLMTYMDYNGTDQIHMGSNTGVLIKHIGHSDFSSPFAIWILSLKKTSSCAINYKKIIECL